MPGGFDGYLALPANRRLTRETDFIVARNGRIASVHLFFDKLS